ncbi:hypothetical protein KKF84_22330, partial [Myxococcota bacterium]|nr:hypothetical protein [Myxococcota bacterium]
TEPAQKMELCRRSSFAWYNRPYCKKVRRKLRLRQFFLEYPDNIRKRFLQECFTTTSLRYPLAKCSIFRRRVKELGFRMHPSCLNRAYDIYWITKCTKYRLKVYAYLKIRKKPSKPALRAVRPENRYPGVTEPPAPQLTDEKRHQPPGVTRPPAHIVVVVSKPAKEESSTAEAPVSSTLPVPAKQEEPFQPKWMFSGSAVFANQTISMGDTDSKSNSVSLAIAGGHFVTPNIVIRGALVLNSIDNEASSSSNFMAMAGVLFYQRYFYIGIDAGIGNFSESADSGEDFNMGVKVLSIPVGILIPLRSYVALDIGVRFYYLIMEDDVSATRFEMGWIGTQFFF